VSRGDNGDGDPFPSFSMRSSLQDPSKFSPMFVEASIVVSFPLFFLFSFPRYVALDRKGAAPSAFSFALRLKGITSCSFSSGNCSLFFLFPFRQLFRDTYLPLFLPCLRQEFIRLSFLKVIFFSPFYRVNEEIWTTPLPSSTARPLLSEFEVYASSKRPFSSPFLCAF